MSGVQGIHLLLPAAESYSFAGQWSSSSVGRLTPKEPAKFSIYFFHGRTGIAVTAVQNRAKFLRLQQVLFGNRPIARNIKCQKLFSSSESPSRSPMKEEIEVVSPPTSEEMAVRPQKLPSMILATPLPLHLKRFSQMAPTDQAFLLLAFIAVMMSGALCALLSTAIPTLHAMRRAALSLERLANVAREELPGTMAAIRLSGMEISDLTLELSDLSQDMSEGIRSSARAVQAAEVGIQRIGSFAVSQTLSMLQERASMPVEAVKPVVATAAETTWQAVTQAQRAVLGLAALPVLSKWIQKKKIEEQKKIEEDMEGAVSATAVSDPVEEFLEE